MSMKRMLLTMVCAGAILFTAACGGGGAADNNNNGGNVGGGNAVGDDAGGNVGGENGGAVVAERPATYDTSCLSCHGTDLEGRVGGNSNLQQVGARMSRDEIATQISEGGNGMPAFANQLSEEEINELADWLATLK